jgi:phosphoenolpyruvate carboxylase
VIDNAQLELTRTHLPTAKLYADRCDDPALRDKFHNLIAGEHTRTVEWVKRITGQEGELMSHAPVVRATVHLRNPAVLPLSLLQVALMERQEKEGESDLLREAILLSITGIAAAMQSTG